MSRSRVVALAILAFLAAGCAAEVKTGPQEVPKELNGLEALSCDVFGFALKVDLEGLESASRRLAEQWSSVREIVIDDGASPKDVAGTDGAIARLRKVLDGRAERVPLARAANAVSLHLDELFGLYRPVVPAGMLALDFLGRELLLDGIQADFTSAAGHTDDLAATWGGLRDRVVGAGGASAAELFDGRVAELRGAVAKRDGEATGRIARQVVEEIDILKAVF